MIKQTKKNPTLVESGNLLEIHFDDVNEIQIITQNGAFKIHKSVTKFLKDHQRLMAKHESLSSNYYPEVDYDLHKVLLRREFREELEGGAHG